MEEDKTMTDGTTEEATPVVEGEEGAMPEATEAPAEAGMPVEETPAA